MTDLVKELYSFHGGYWRYPDLLDFYYLVNPYFPSPELVDELKDYLGVLLAQYPSGFKVITDLAEKNYGIKKENIFVGNGSSELIKFTMDYIQGKIGIVRPTFDEYANRYDSNSVVAYWPTNKDYSYSSSDLIEYFEDKTIEAIVIINPDNPSGNLLRLSELEDLLSWTKKSDIKLIIDESFIDFSEAPERDSLMTQDYIDQNGHLTIIKSISKSYGIPGLRIGIIASGDSELLNYVKSNIPIWNMNSFAEFYLQIAGKYENDYRIGMDKFRKERSRYFQNLCSIESIRPIPSQANYFMVEITNGFSSTKITETLMSTYNILVRDLKNKLQTDAGQYLRIAIRGTADNDQMMDSLRNIFREV